MRAVVHDSYGPPDVLRIEEIESPVPHDDEILVEIHATTVTRTDTHLRAGEPSSAASSRVCGARGGKSAASSSRERSELSGKPSCTSRSATRSSASAGSLSLVCLGHADLHDGDRILVYGASGSIGSAVVQVANALGADVTGVCNTKRNGETYDVIFDAVGKQSFRRCKDSLAAGGRYVATDGLRNIVLAPWTSRFGDKKVVFPIPPRYTKKDLLFLKSSSKPGSTAR